MGIQGLNEFIKKKCNFVNEITTLSNFKNKKIAIDTSLYLYKFKCGYGENNWLSGFINLCCCLEEYKTIPVFIFDNGCPIEKIQEQQRRRAEVKKRVDVIETIEKSIEIYRETGIISDILMNYYTKNCWTKSDGLISSFLNTNNEPVFNLNKVLDDIEKKKKQNITITEQDLHLLKTFFDLIGVQHFMGILEAEATCCYLLNQNLVDLVLSEDSDVLAYGAKISLSKLNTSTGYCKMICFDTLMEGIGLDKKQFVDFCIMIGCDYNKRIKGFGPVACFKLIEKYKCLEEVVNNEPKFENVNFTRMRELFSNQEVDFNVKSKRDFVNWMELEIFLSSHNLGYLIGKIRRNFVDCNEKELKNCEDYVFLDKEGNEEEGNEEEGNEEEGNEEEGNEEEGKGKEGKEEEGKVKFI
jgi:flap endonuclease-1